MYATRGEYNGHALIQFWNKAEDVAADKKPVFAMGMKKALVCVEHIEAIKTFVLNEQAKAVAPPETAPALAVAPAKAAPVALTPALTDNVVIPQLKK